MPGFENPDGLVTLADQMKSEEGPVALANLFAVDTSDEVGLVQAWVHGADFMKARGIHLEATSQGDRGQF